MLLDLDRPTFLCRVLDLWYLGEHDPRIEVHSREGPITVELFCPMPEAPAQPAWYAVRIHADQRQVWCGPQRPCPPEQAVRFVDDLLNLDEATLARRYRRLG